MSAYAKLVERFRRLTLVEEAAAMLHWDMATVMPDGAAGARTEQLTELSVVAHERLTDPALAELLEQASGEPLDAEERVSVAEMRRVWAHATAVPADLVAALARATSECEIRWRSARADNDFAGLRPFLGEVLRLTRAVAEAKAPALGVTPYDALLDACNPGARTTRIDTLFDELAAFLPGFVDATLARQAAAPAPLPLPGPFPIPKQHELALRLMKTLGFDFEHGRLDTSHHPFCGGVSEDVRITTRWSVDDVLTGMFAVLHETGHAMYERQRPTRWHYLPMGAARGMALHESQSLLVEMRACRARPFLAWLARELAGAFGGQGPAWSGENLYRLATRVRRSLIRVDADEATYSTHVILRYRLERALVGGDLALDDLPGAWRDGMAALVGVAPTDDRDGCLQDIHWPTGAWGYFPSYTLGAMAGAQIFDAATAAVPSIPDDLGRGDFRPLMGWLRVNVHERASSASTDEILTAATGRPLETAAYLRHLGRRYLSE